MPTVRFEANELGPEVTVEVASGDLVDVCDDARAPVAFSCRSASCGTCRCEVVEGSNLLEPPSADEKEVLDIFRSSPSTRLACQARVKKGAGTIVLRWVSDEP
jgi:ferredoxin